MAQLRKDLLGLRDVSCDEIEHILDTADQMKHVLLGSNKKTSHLQGKSIVTLFYENSTRTRMSFELASKYMSSASANIAASSSSVQKGETLIDTGRTLDMMGTDIIIIRHPMTGAPHLLAKHVSAGVINAGDGINEHPTQALLDMMSIREQKHRLTGLKIAIVGDVLHSRVARSNLWALSKFQNEIWLAGPSTLLPPDLEKLGLGKTTVRVTRNVEEAICDADVVMGLRIQKERQQSGILPSMREYSRFYGIHDSHMEQVKPDCIIMHPGPMNRGVEIDSSVADEERSVIQEQVRNGVAVRMALLYLLTRRGAAQ